MKRFLAALLTVCMVCSFVPSFATAEQPLEEEFILIEDIPEIEEELMLEEEPDMGEFLPDVLEEEPLFTEELVELEENLAPQTDADRKLTAYIERSYSLILGRQGDKAGIEYWVSTLKSGAAAGAAIVDSFCGSPEFMNKGLSDREVVEILYRTMMDREPDSGGVDYWTGFLDKGTSIHYVINGFASSAEFRGICRTYGISAGSVALENRDLNPFATAFISRCYEVALRREADAEGLNGWTGNLLSGSMSIQQISYEFLFSDEFKAWKYTHNGFVDRLYKLYMNREVEYSENRKWADQLFAGNITRKKVAQAFANSDEFANIVHSYGLDFVKEDSSSDPLDPDKPLTLESILALLDAYDPDGAFIIRNSDGSTLMPWFRGAATLGEAVSYYNFMTQAIHEQCHDFTARGGWQTDNIYLGNGNYIQVPYTDVFDSIEMIATIPADLKNTSARYRTYLDNPEERLASRQHGVYGLLNEFTAYCWEVHNALATSPYAKKNDLERLSNNGFLSYAEFRYYILHYMLYARNHHPDVYQGILNNSSFKTAFSSVEATFRQVVEKTEASVKFNSAVNSYNLLMNEMSKPEYVNMANLLKP